MIDFLFFVKTFLLTVAIVIGMQIQVGNSTIENHAMGWVQSSSVAQPINGIARGAAKLVHDLTQKIWSGLHKNEKKKNKKEEARSGAPSFIWQHSQSGS